MHYVGNKFSKIALKILAVAALWCIKSRTEVFVEILL